MLIKGPIPTPNTIVRHSFRLTFRKQRMVNFSLLFNSRGWDVLILTFHMATSALFLLFEKLPIVVSIVF